mmetsp:Transcript_53502/g.148009  ORF Transcript_53502/g.148009 Transcript_53502/m.148009 type:complete len:121 (+) Transcript_53502:170-532(+)
MAPSTTGVNLMQLLTSMRNFGVGVNVRRSVWSNPGCYWTITRVKPNPKAPYSNGKVWGVYYWNHRKIYESQVDKKITGVLKKQWLLDAEQAVEPDLLRRIKLPPGPGQAVEAVEEAAQSA